MAISMMIQKQDSERILHLQQALGIHKKIDVLRAGLDLLEQTVSRSEREQRWQRAVAIVSKTSRAVNRDFQKHARIKK